MNSHQEVALKENSFLSEVLAESGENLQACYQCQKCSAGCPVAEAMDLLPNQVLRHIQYGHREKVLGSKTIWICASCYTCSVRCPNDIDIAKIMDTLRHLALRSGWRRERRRSLFFILSSSTRSNEEDGSTRSASS